jgi:hypothetical protein
MLFELPFDPCERPDLDMDALQQALEKRLKARAARADAAVEINAETLHRWVEEELETLVSEYLVAHELANAVVLN